MAQMEFDHNPHASTGIKLINASEELIESLEENQVREIKQIIIFHEHSIPPTNIQHSTMNDEPANVYVTIMK